MTTTVIHHSADFDGLFCREIARKFLPDAKFIGWDHGQPPLPIPNEGQIYILDLPVAQVFGTTGGALAIDEGQLCFLSAVARPVRIELSRIIWIDHHKSSIETHPADIPGYRVDGMAACRLAWQWFNDPTYGQFRNCLISGSQLPGKQRFVDRLVPEPWAVRLAGEYDVWDKRDPDAEVFQFGLRGVELSVSHWNDLLSTAPDRQETVRELLEDGKMLQSYQQRNDSDLVRRRGYMVEWEGLRFLSLNTAICNSLTFAAKDVPETGHDALMGCRWDGQQWHVSLYHARHRTDLDLSAIAVKHGGGGHRGACGFTTKLLFPQNENTK